MPTGIRLSPRGTDLYSRIDAMRTENQIRNSIADITEKLRNNPGDTVMLFERATLWEQIGEIGHAVNDLIEILKTDPENFRAKNRINYLKTILKFQNIDIFSDTNTHHDPWEE